MSIGKLFNLTGPVPDPSILAQAISPSRPSKVCPLWICALFEGDAAHPAVGVVIEGVEVAGIRLMGVCWPKPYPTFALR